MIGETIGDLHSAGVAVDRCVELVGLFHDREPGRVRRRDVDPHRETMQP
jgi:hypothetical protein